MLERKGRMAMVKRKDEKCKKWPDVQLARGWEVGGSIWWERNT